MVDTDAAGITLDGPRAFGRHLDELDPGHVQQPLLVDTVVPRQLQHRSARANGAPQVVALSHQHLTIAGNQPGPGHFIEMGLDPLSIERDRPASPFRRTGPCLFLGCADPVRRFARPCQHHIEAFAGRQ
ncbi:hypothetical protein D3C80_1709940 [compost metagenome]